MSITITSTSDSPEAVQAALGAKVADKVDEKAAKPKAEAKESAADEPAETLDASDASVENKENGDSELEDSSEESEEKPKKSGVQKRIDKLTKRVSEREREIEFWKAEALKGKDQPASKGPAKKEVKIEGKPAKPNLNEFETHEAYELARDDYFEKLADFKAEQKILEREQKAKELDVKTQFQRQVETHQSRVREFVKAHEDFDEVIGSVDDVPMSLTVQNLILESDVGPALMYEMARDKAEYQKICAMSPQSAAKAIGRMEAKLEGSKESPIKKEVSKAPAPLKAVKGDTKAPARSLYDADISQAEFERLRAKQERERKAN